MILLEQRPDSLITVKFKVNDVPGSITDSAASTLNDMLTEFLETVNAFDAEIEYETILERAE